MDIEIYIDLNRNNSFDHPLSNVTERARDGIFFTSGFPSGKQTESNPSAYVAPVNQAKFTLHNSDSELSFEKVGADFYNLLHSSLQVKFIVSCDGTSHEFIYYTSKIIEHPGKFGVQTVEVQCVCAMERFQMLEYEPDVEQDVTTSTAIANMMGTGDLTLPYTSTYFFIDASSIDGDSLIFDADTHVPLYTDIETGYTTMEYVGDVLRKDQYDVPVQKAMMFASDVCNAEGFGRFFYQPRDNKFHWHSRYHDRLQSTSLTLTEFSDVKVMTTPVYNDVKVHYTPRKVGTPNSIMFQSEQTPIDISAGSTKTIRVRFSDPDNEDETIAALVVDEPEIGSDIIVTDEDDNEITTQVYREADLNGTGGRLTFENTTDKSVNITSLKVRGTPITMYQEQIAEARNGESIFQYNLQPLPPVRGPYISRDDFAQNIANFLLLRHKTMRRVLDSVTIIVDDDNFGDVMSVTIGDVVQIQDSWTAHDEEYVVLGEFHQYDAGRNLYQLKWYLRSNNTTPYFIIDESSIDGDDIIGY
jgi:hypothetical protein